MFLRHLILTITLCQLSHGEDRDQHWAFQTVVDPGLPETRHPVDSPLDAWHQESLREQGLPKAAEATPLTLSRRLAFHLHGLPPTEDDIESFLADPSPNAYQRQLDRLLASPRFGERWARHWMDVSRYADNKGYVFEEERRYAYAYTFRDWLVSAFNQDLPYNDFIVQQIAGDHVAETTGNNLAYAAMGYLTLGRRFLNREPDIIDDRIDVVTRGMLGLTVACARCHDHKFDPIPTADYYSLYGVFASSFEPDEKPLLSEPDASSPAYQEFLAKSAEHEAKIDEFFRVRHAKLRTAEVLQAYFALAHDGRDWDEPKIGKRAQSEKLYQKIAIRWRDRIIDLSQENHPAIIPWKALAAIEDLNAPKAAAALKSVEQESHPQILNALAEAKVSSMAEVFTAYAKVIAAANAPEPHSDPDRESLRQLLIAKDSPTGLEPEKLYRIFNTPDQQAVRRMRRALKKHQALSPGAPPRGMALLDRDKPTEPHIFVRGNARSRGDKVPRQYLAALSKSQRKPFEDGSGRFELAQHIANADNPLTARVFVNRAWMHLFGKPIVDSPSDFGIRTEAPPLVNVLDRLASDFMYDGWSMKRLLREIVQSEAYRQSGRAPEKALESDPANLWFSRMNRQRLDFESMRDSLLASGEGIDLKIGGQPANLFSKPFTPRRAIYGFIDRQNLPGTFRTFDMASPDAHTPRRLETMVPQQALFMMNGPLVENQAIKLGLWAESQVEKAGAEKAIIQLYQRLLARAPDDEETTLGLEFINQWKPSEEFSSGWQAYAHALLCSNEFMFID